MYVKKRNIRSVASICLDDVSIARGYLRQASRARRWLAICACTDVNSPSAI